MVTIKGRKSAISVGHSWDTFSQKMAKNQNSPQQEKLCEALISLLP